MDFMLVPHGTDAYQETVRLRDAILRKPLGMVFTEAQLAAEAEQTHIAYFEEGKAVACLVLVIKKDGTAKMRQVAVSEAQQKRGIGQQMVRFSEDWAKQQGCTLMYCHARDLAKSFYLKLNYKVTGDSFQEVGILHWRMEKVL